MTDHSHHSGSPSAFETKVKTDSARFERNLKAMAEMVAKVRNEEQIIAQGGGEKAIASQHKKGPPDRARAHCAADRSRHRVLRAGWLCGVGNVRRVGRRAFGRRGDWIGAGARAPGHADRERRHGEGGRVLSHDGEEGDSRAEHRHRQPHSHDLPGGFRRRVSAAAGRRLPRHRRLWPRLPQQRGDVGDGHSADRGHHGHVRGRRRVSAADVRSHPDDRRQRAVPRRTGAGAGGHRREIFGRRTGRREDALADQRHRGLPRAGRRVVPDAHSSAGGQDGQSPARRLRPQEAGRAALSPRKKSTASSMAIPRASTT